MKSWCLPGPVTVSCWPVGLLAFPRSVFHSVDRMNGGRFLCYASTTQLVLRRTAVWERQPRIVCCVFQCSRPLSPISHCNLHDHIFYCSSWPLSAQPLLVILQFLSSHMDRKIIFNCLISISKFRIWSVYLLFEWGVFIGQPTVWISGIRHDSQCNTLSMGGGM